MADEVDPHAQVSVSDDHGRTLTGIGVSEAALDATIDRHADAAPEPSAAPAPDADAPPAAPGPKPTRGQARFSELAAQRKDAEAKAAAAEQRALAAEARLAQQPQTPARQEAAPQPPAQAQPQAPPLTRQKPTEDDIGVGLKYESYGAFVEDLAEWKAEQRDAAREAKQAAASWQQTRTARLQAHQTREVALRGQVSDYDAAIAAVDRTHQPSAVLVDALLSSDRSAEVAYWLATHPQDYAQLIQESLSVNQPSAVGLVRAVLESRLPAVVPPARPVRPVAAPPAPVQPVGSGSRATTLTSAEAAEAGNYSEYKARRAAERRGRS